MPTYSSGLIPPHQNPVRTPLYMPPTPHPPSLHHTCSDDSSHEAPHYTILTHRPVSRRTVNTQAHTHTRTRAITNQPSEIERGVRAGRTDALHLGYSEFISRPQE